MTMSYVFLGIFALSLLSGIGLGNTQELSSALMEGATSGVTLCLSMTGGICLWMGVMEVMRQSGLSNKLARALAPLLGRLYPDFAQDRRVMDALSANVSANLLGLGNAATPFGLEAAQRMARVSPQVASDSLCLLIVCNTASIQLIPTTIATVRGVAGAEHPFDILPAVWISSLISVTVGIVVAKAFGRLWRRWE